MGLIALLTFSWVTPIQAAPMRGRFRTPPKTMRANIRLPAPHVQKIAERLKSVQHIYPHGPIIKTDQGEVLKQGWAPAIKASASQDDPQKGKAEFDKQFDNGANLEPGKGEVFGEGFEASRPQGARESFEVSPESDRDFIEFHGKETIRVPVTISRPGTKRVDLTLAELMDNHKDGVPLKIAAYQFSNKAVFAAVKRNVSRYPIKVILDMSYAFPRSANGKPHGASEEIQDLFALERELSKNKPAKGGLDIRVVIAAGIQHNKFMLFGDELLETGSYNYSESGEHSHFETADFFDAQERIRLYHAYFDWQWEQFGQTHLQLVRKGKQKWDRPTGWPAPKDVRFNFPHVVQTVSFRGKLFPLTVFSPNGFSREYVIDAINLAQKSVDFGMFSMWDIEIAQALTRAKERGVAVRIVLDNGQSLPESPVSQFIIDAFGVNLRLAYGPATLEERETMTGWQKAHEKMHTKFLMIDGEDAAESLLVSGSHNASKNADLYNFENSNYMTGRARMANYRRIFEAIFRFANVPHLEIALKEPPPPPKAEEGTKTDKEEPEGDMDAELPTGSENTLHRTFKVFNKFYLPRVVVNPPAKEFDMTFSRSLSKVLNEAPEAIPVRIAARNWSDAEVHAAVKANAGRHHIQIFLAKEASSQDNPAVAELKELAAQQKIELKIADKIESSFAVFGDKVLQTGSYDYSGASLQHHIEHLEFHNNPMRIHEFIGRFDLMWKNGGGLPGEGAQDPPPQPNTWGINFRGKVFDPIIFSPNGRARETVLEALKMAKKSVTICLPKLYDPDFADAILKLQDLVKEDKLQLRIVLNFNDAPADSPLGRFIVNKFKDIVRLVRGPHTDADKQKQGLTPEAKEAFLTHEKMNASFILIDEDEPESLLLTGSHDAVESGRFQYFQALTDRVFVETYRAFFKHIYQNIGMVPFLKINLTRPSDYRHWKETIDPPQG
ncbi:MAG: hypothetical protein HY611_00350 [Elusimicrobia bacterium]|nr:hypothetical protein [Elusimicrobiota bacterium]